MSWIGPGALRSSTRARHRGGLEDSIVGREAEEVGVAIPGPSLGVSDPPSPNAPIGGLVNRADSGLLPRHTVRLGEYRECPLVIRVSVARSGRT